MRTHVAATSDQIVLHDTVDDEFFNIKFHYKPKGFWYEVDGDWRRWCEGEGFGLRNGHIHEVALKDCRVRMIDTLEKLHTFHREYVVSFPDYQSIKFLDWKRVQKKWDGVEIAPYQWDRSMAHDFMWYYGWDCASGVIWRPRNATVTYVGVYERKEQEEEVQP